jgi:hypothetical protein
VVLRLEVLISEIRLLERDVKICISKEVKGTGMSNL